MITLILMIVILVLIFRNTQLKKTMPPTLPEEEINYNTKYIKKIYLVTETELKFYKQLKKITDELNLTICPQVALYEILRNKDYRDFNQIKSKCIDFVITEPNLKIRMCIELDDTSHYRINRIKRDIFIDKLFKDLEIKLIRIKPHNFYNLDELKCKIKESL